MNKQSTINREFNRVYANIKELYRRINDSANNYPKAICGAWFANHVEDLLDNEQLKAKLTELQVVEIITMATDLSKQDSIQPEDKERLIDLIERLENNNNKGMEL